MTGTQRLECLIIVIDASFLKEQNIWYCTLWALKALTGKATVNYQTL